MTDDTCSIENRDTDVQLRDDQYPYPPGQSVKLYWGQCRCDTSLVRRGDRRVCPGCGHSSELDEVDKAILAGQYGRPFSGVNDR